MRVREYSLRLDVDFAAETFAGSVDIAVDDPGRPFVLDAAELAIDSATVDGAEVPVAADAARQRLEVDLGDRASATVRIRYRGRARRNVLTGPYVASFGTTKVITTMMEPTGCRFLLPCVDRPNQKAVFRLEVTTDDGLTVISNGAVASSEAVGGRRRWTFEPTPRMSTYLVYLGIGPFDTASRTEDGVTVIVATAPGRAAEAARPLALAGGIVRGYGEYYGLPYPLPKLHLVAVPDLWAGGMENWGAIAVPEIGLLWDDATSPAIVRWAVETLAHEIAHQWFGNLVTMDTFDDLWLNESVTTFVAARMTERLRLRHDPWAEFVIRTAPGYGIDSLHATHPVQMHLRDPSEISQSTDEITYYKGANIVRMIEAYLGEARFREGLRTYLARFQFGNARGDDLWQTLEAATHEPVQRVMRAWIDRPGLPVVRVRPSDGGLTLTQERFTLGGPVESEPWPIPLRSIDGDEERSVLFDGRTTHVPIRHPGRVRLNPGRTAFVRLEYAPELKDRAIAELAQWPSIDRWAFLNDALALLYAGDVTLEEYLAAIDAVRGVDDYPSVQEATGGLGRLRALLPGEPRVDAVARRFFREQADRLGLAARPGEPDVAAINREAVVGGRVRSDPAFARELAARFDAIDRADAAIRPAIAVAFAKGADAAGLDRLFARIRDAPVQDAREQAAYALEGLPTPELFASALDRCFRPEIRATITLYMVQSMAVAPAARAAVWSWMLGNLREFERRAEGSWLLYQLTLRTLPWVGLDRRPEVEAYFERERFPEGAMGIARGLEILRAAERLRARVLGERPG